MSFSWLVKNSDYMVKLSACVAWTHRPLPLAPGRWMCVSYSLRDALLCIPYHDRPLFCVRARPWLYVRSLATHKDMLNHCYAYQCCSPFDSLILEPFKGEYLDYIYLRTT
jgi:hypothetical protein